MLGEGSQPVGHTLCRHKRAAGEGQRKEPDEVGGLRCLHAAHKQPDCCRDPREGKAGEQEQPRCRHPGNEKALWSKANQQADRPHHHHNERVAYQVRECATCKDGRFRHRQGAKAVDQAALQVSGQADAGGRRAEDDGLSEDASHQVIDIGGATDRDRPPNT